MPWTSTLATPLKLRDGRKLTTLHDVRELFLDFPRPRVPLGEWRRTAELLMKSAAKPAFQADLQRQLEGYLSGLQMM
jgi:hypothetical protein